jgi:hypothetical protein
MRTETEICNDAMAILNTKLGPVETEVFISTLIREPQDYTKWQRTLWADKTIDQIFDEASDFEKQQDK